MISIDRSRHPSAQRSYGVVTVAEDTSEENSIINAQEPIDAKVKSISLKLFQS